MVKAQDISPFHPGQDHAQQIGRANLRSCASGNSVWFLELQIQDRHDFCLEGAAGEVLRTAIRPLFSVHRPQQSF